MTGRTITLAGYAAIVAAACAWQIVAVRHPRFGTAGPYLRWLLRFAPLRVFALLGWAWVGWHLFAR